MFRRASATGKLREGFFSVPRVLAVIAICAFVATPFLPWLESGVQSSPMTLKELGAHLVNSKLITVNLWPIPIILAALFLLPLLTDLRLTRAIYYLLLIAVLVASVFFLYPTTHALLFRAGIQPHDVKLHYGFHVFLIPFPLLMISGLADLLRSRTGIVILILSVICTTIIVAGNLTGWFGYLVGEPKMWHEQFEARFAGSQALGTHLSIANDGWGVLRLGLTPSNRPQEVGLIISAQRYYRIGDFWADTPIEPFLTPPSKALLPAELRSGDVLMLDLIFGPLTKKSNLSALPMVGASGRYTICLTDPVRKRIYRHEIDIPPASEDHTL